LAVSKRARGEKSILSAEPNKLRKASWTAAGSEAPRRFRPHKTRGTINPLRPLEGGVAAALCHRSPRSPSPSLARVWMLRCRKFCWQRKVVRGTLRA
jgi:hypothetical protein